MQLYFLSAALPLSKTLTPTDVQPYPMVKNFTSMEERITSIDGFFAAINRHAQQGHALLKGLLDAPLENESKAGKVPPNQPTEWIVFDTDSLPLENAEDFIRQLPSDFHSISYVEQISSTAFYKNNGYKAHIFFLLSAPVTPQAIRDFILHLNLTTFAIHIELGTGGLCLSYALDTQVNFNSTPLYIAPPTLVDVNSPVTDRIKLVKKTIDYVTLPEPPPISRIKSLQQKYIKLLREPLGLKNKTPKIGNYGENGILENAEPMRTPPIKTERGFVYFQFNKNPYSYYHPEDDPSVIRNFKGEPFLKTSQVLPEYWAEIQAKALDITYTGEMPALIFRDIKRDMYYNGHMTDDGYDIFPCRSSQRLKDFAKNNKIPMPDPIPDWTVTFDPTNLTAPNPRSRYLNMFIPSSYIKRCVNDNPSAPSDIPPTIKSVLVSVTGDDEDCFNRFINWLAFIFQTRKKTRTAWVLQGVEGTGKGLLFEHILSPLFGKPYCVEKTLNNLQEKFNDWIEKTIILFLDEARITGKAAYEQLPNLLKNLITEPTQTVRAMRENQITVPNYTNLIVATNDGDALTISETDRRYNVCPPQTNPLRVPDDITKRIANELNDLAAYLWHYSVIKQNVHTVMLTEAKIAMYESRLGDIDLFCKHLRDGNFLWFLDFYTESIGATPDHQLIKQIVREWALRFKQTPSNTVDVRVDELRTLFNFIQKKEVSPIKFNKDLKRNKLELTRKRLTHGNEADKQVYIVPVTWKIGLKELGTFSPL